MPRNNTLLLQSVLGALIAVNLKNSLKQLADPYYLWRKSKLDCVSTGQPGEHPCPTCNPELPLVASPITTPSLTPMAMPLLVQLSSEPRV